ncbi:hypothetical protein MET9862_02507 [Methylobacterium symbioticum]|uniref:Uncharacterized protein n=1 Tax=Methylobacterium symbioticum TaxID=2584084 RepID=A0A509EEL2_9HYPH|nr:hypothetical protein MET9862_02507 [Methylobacterium symbioticum]
MARSDTTAPGWPSTLWAPWSVAWLRLGSSIDHVASATVSAMAPVNRTRPPNSVSRRARNGRTVSTTVSKGDAERRSERMRNRTREGYSAGNATGEPLTGG